MPANGQLPQSDLAPIAGGQLRKDAAAAWNAMNVEARSRGLELKPTGSKSSYRTLAQQNELYNAYLKGGNLAAKPGTSNHGTGIAIDLATPQMRTMVDQIGAKYGFSKSWSDAPSEWWHIVYQPGHYSGADPGPTGKATPTAAAPAKTTKASDMITAVLKQDGRIEVFVERASDGQVFHTWQTAKDGGWAGSAKGKNASWYTLGTPGKG